MAFVAQVSADLASLANESRKRSSDVKAAVEAALSEAKRHPNGTVSTPSLLNVLCEPFVLALETGNGKQMAIALKALLRLVSTGLLTPEHVSRILGAFKKTDISSLPMETQLKVLQAMPAILQSYATSDRELKLVLAITCGLSYSSDIVVHNTASATLQQLVTSLFEKLKWHTPSERSHNVQGTLLDDLELQAYSVFSDLSAIVSGQTTTFFDSLVQIRRASVLEIIENVLALNKDVFSRPELVHILKSKLIPALMAILESSENLFPLICRALRTVNVLLATQLLNVKEEAPDIFAQLDRVIVNNLELSKQIADAANTTFTVQPYWKEVLVIEMYRHLFSDFSVAKNLFQLADKIGKRPVFLGILQTLDAYLSDNFPAFFSSDTVQMPPEKQSGLHLGKAAAPFKSAIIDHLDKHDAPSNIPALYTCHLAFRFLMSLTDGVLSFVERLSGNSGAKDFEADAELISTMNEAIFPEVFQLYGKFLHCSLDQEYFHLTVRSLQKFTHLIGLLGLLSLRDGLLLMLSDAITKSAPEDKKKLAGAAQLLAIGESIVETISSTIQAPTSLTSQMSERSSNPRTPDLEQGSFTSARTFNLRQVICLRALTNLAISLGSTLQNSWGIILVTFQWVDYYVNGPDEFNTYNNIKNKLNLSTQDISTIKSSRVKLYESFEEYPFESFQELITVFIGLYAHNEDTSREKSVLPVEICPFNRSFFVELALSALQINPRRFLIERTDIWDSAVAFFTAKSVDRTLAPNVRIYLCKLFTKMVLQTVKEGFETDDEVNVLARRAIEAFSSFMKALFSSDRATSLMVVNCETEMHLTVLTAVHELIDSYDRYFQNSWDLIFEVLNSAFMYLDDKTGDANLAEKNRFIVSKSYDTLKLVLNEFLSTLPFNQLKILIDTLVNFCSQRHELNISFGSVSNFWMISDNIKAKISDLPTDRELLRVQTIQELELLLEDKYVSGMTYRGLNVYLIAKLADLTKDPRAQVREGAIQTLFQIVDVQGNFFPSWDATSHIAFPTLFDTSFMENGENRDSLISSANLILSGLVSLLSGFMVDFTNNVVPRYWDLCIEYFAKLLDLNWKKLNSRVFDSFASLVEILSRKQGVPELVSGALFQFWAAVPIEYDFVNHDYQDALAVYNAAFQHLYGIVRDDLNYEDILRILSNLNKSARYPILKANQDDSKKPTVLQVAVMKNLEIIDGSDQVLAMVIQQLSIILAYPFETRSRIESKLNKFEGKLRVPTFDAVSQEALTLMSAKFAQMGTLSVMLKNSSLVKVMRSLLDLIQYKAPGATGGDPLWVQCQAVFVSLVERLLAHHADDIRNDEPLWRLLLESFTLCFAGKDAEQERHNMRQYDALTALLVPSLFSLGHPQRVERFIHSIYMESYLYELDESDQELVGASELVEEICDATVAYKFDDFGSTAPLVVHGNREIRLRCLRELFEFASSDGVAAMYAVTRAALALKRFVADEQLLYKKPLPKIQEEELAVVFEGMLKMGRSSREWLYPLISKAMGYAGRVGRGGEVERLVAEVLG